MARPAFTGWVADRTFPWENPELDTREMFAIYGPGEIEKLLYGSLVGPHHWERSEAEWAHIDAILTEIERQPDMEREFRRWLQEAAGRGELTA